MEYNFNKSVDFVYNNKNVKQEILSSGEKKKKKKKEELDFGFVDDTISSKKFKKKNHTFHQHEKSSDKSELSTDLFENKKKEKKKNEHNTSIVTSSEKHSADEKLTGKKKKEKVYDEPLEIKQEILSSDEKKKELDFGLEGEEITPSKKFKKKNYDFDKHKKRSDKSELSTVLFENKKEKKKKEHNTSFKEKKKKEHNTSFVTSSEEHSADEKLKDKKEKEKHLEPLEIKQEILSSGEKKKKKKKKKKELNFDSEDKEIIPSKKFKKKKHDFDIHKKSSDNLELSTDLFENKKEKKKKEHNTSFVTSSEQHSTDEKRKDKKKKEKRYDEPLEIKQEILSSGEKKKELEFGLEGEEITPSKKFKKKKHDFDKHKKSSDKSELSTDLFENKKEKKKKEHNTSFVISSEEHSADEKLKDKKKKEKRYDEPLEEGTKDHKKKLKKKKEVYDVEMEETDKVPTDKITKECFTEGYEEEEPKKKKKKKRHRVDSEMLTDYSIINENLNDTEIFTPEKVKHKKRKHSSNETSDINTETEVHKKKKKHKHDKKHKYHELPIEICQTKSDSLEDAKKFDQKSETLSEEISETTALFQKSHKKFKNSEFDVSDSAVKNSEDEDPKPKKAKPQLPAEDVNTENTSLDNLLLNDSKDLEKLVKLSEKKKVTSESRNFEEICNGLENFRESHESLKNNSSDSAFEVSDSVFENKKSKHQREKSNLDAKIQTLISENNFKTDDSEEKSVTSGLSLQSRESVFCTPDFYFEDILEKDKNELSYEERQRLKNFNVLLPWPAHPLHCIETRVAKGPSDKQWKEINALKIKIKRGIFNKSEDEIIRRNWEEFCKLHDMPLNPKYFLRCKTSEGKVLMPIKEKVRFVQFLAHDLPNRLLHTVYMRFQRIFFPKELKTGRFTPEEDNIILQYLKTSRSQTPYADLAKILNRDNFSIEKRHRKLKYTLEGNFRVKWNSEQIANFMQHLLDVTKVESVEQLEHRNITSEEWKEMSTRLNIPTIRLRPAWLIKIHPRIFINHTVSSNDIKQLLVDVLIEKGKSDWRDVNWQEIAEEFDGFTGLALNKMMRDIVQTHIPVNKRSDLGECLKCLANQRYAMGRKIRKIDIIEIDVRN
ncbi:uncharacterized protein DDB_G0283697-like [Tribolium madens]|uniref:uncharacterized protein DDB_G0283697-like n=1 Tax=Tribolium madens TaxID=41895 RepID=UPI001CF749C7|nr:uncharacterized protein DDB_G0283697-like [Tribolium madens]